MKLLDYLPEKYERSVETAAVQNAIQPESDALWAARDYLLQQLDPRTASGKGLKLWEAAMGVRPAAGDGLEQRRGRVVAKIRGMGVVDAALLKAVIESFGLSSAEVMEYPRENWVDIQYSTAGLHPPPDHYEIADAVLEILPAHIGLGILAEAETVTSDLRLTPAAASGSETALPEWEKDHNFAQAIKIMGEFGVCSITELPSM